MAAHDPAAPARRDSSPRLFRYAHAGNLATIGKRAAVIDFGWIKLRGWIAWWIWGLAHIYFLIGVRNRLAVALSWLWIYVTGTRGACLITQGEQRPQSAPPARQQPDPAGTQVKAGMPVCALPRISA